MERIFIRRVCSKCMPLLFSHQGVRSCVLQSRWMCRWSQLSGPNSSLLQRLPQTQYSPWIWRGVASKPAKNKSMGWLVALGMAGIGGAVYVGLEYQEAIKKKGSLKKKVETAGQVEIGGKPWTLTDHHGVARTDKDFEDQWILFYFGFTHCPDVCPDELDKVAKVVDALDKDSDLPKLKPLFVTLDPERDTKEVLKEYCEEFTPKLLGLTGTKEQLENIIKAYRIFYSKGPVDDSGDYLIDHTIVSYLVRPDGVFSDYFPKRVTEEMMVKQIGIRMKNFANKSKKQ